MRRRTVRVQLSQKEDRKGRWRVDEDGEREGGRGGKGRKKRQKDREERERGEDRDLFVVVWVAERKKVDTGKSDIP